jgi:hypothetical protein
MLQTQAALDKDRFEFAILGYEMAKAVEETAKATTKVMGTAAKAVVTTLAGHTSQLATAATTAEELEPGFWRQIVREVLTAKSWGGLKQAFDQFGSALVNAETTATALYGSSVAQPLYAAAVAGGVGQQSAVHCGELPGDRLDFWRAPHPLNVAPHSRDPVRAACRRGGLCK